MLGGGLVVAVASAVAGLQTTFDVGMLLGLLMAGCGDGSGDGRETLLKLGDVRLFRVGGSGRRMRILRTRIRLLQLRECLSLLLSLDLGLGQDLGLQLRGGIGLWLWL